MAWFHHIFQIFSGWLRLVYDKLLNKTNTKSLYRLNICENCEHNSHGICTLCGCVLAAKVRVDYPEDNNGISIGGCPQEKW